MMAFASRDLVRLGLWCGLVLGPIAACGSSGASDGSGADADGGVDGAESDASRSESGQPTADAGADAKTPGSDGGRRDAAADVGTDATAEASADADAGATDATDADTSAPVDSGLDAAANGDAKDAQPIDAGVEAGADAGPVDAGIVVSTCSALTLESSVPAAGALLAEDSRAVVFLANGTQWTTVAGGVGTTGASTKPPNTAKMTNVRTEVTPAGHILVQYTSNGSTFATFWNGTSYASTTALPQDAVTVHADAQDRLYVLDANRVLYSQNSSGTFDNLGALPLSIYASEVTFQVDHAGTVHMARIEPGAKVRLELLLRPRGGSWSTPIVVHQDDHKFPLHAPMLATGRDGSVHVAWWRGNPNGWPRQNFYSRSYAGAAWTTPEVIASGAALLALEARTYDTAQGLTETNDYIDGFGNNWVRRCAPPNAQGWPSTPLTTDPASYDKAEMRASPSGKPVFLLSAKSVGRVVVRAQ